MTKPALGAALEYQQLEMGTLTGPDTRNVTKGQGEGHRETCKGEPGALATSWSSLHSARLRLRLPQRHPCSSPSRKPPASPNCPAQPGLHGPRTRSCLHKALGVDGPGQQQSWEALPSSGPIIKHLAGPARAKRKGPSSAVTSEQGGCPRQVTTMQTIPPRHFINLQQQKFTGD